MDIEDLRYTIYKMNQIMEQLTHYKRLCTAEDIDVEDLKRGIGFISTFQEELTRLEEEQRRQNEEESK